MSDVTTGADASTVRHWNERAVIDAMEGRANLRVAEVATLTGLTSASAGDVLRGLQRKGWVEELSPERSGMGRPARSYRLRELPVSVLGVDVGGHTVRAVLLRPDGTVEQVGRAAIPEPRGTVESMLDAVRRATHGVDPDKVWMTGAAISGAIDATGTVIRSVALPHLEGLDAHAILASAVPGPLRIYHDTRAALWAESTAAPPRHVMLIHLGRRPSIAWVLNGADYLGAHGTAGDLAASDLIQPWEGIARHAGLPDPVGASLEAAGAGDREAVSSAREFFRRITPQLAFAIALVDPATVVVAGALAPAVRDLGEEFLVAVSARVQVAPEIRFSSLDEFAVASGAAQLARARVRRLLLENPGGVAAAQRSSLGGNLSVS